MGGQNYFEKNIYIGASFEINIWQIAIEIIIIIKKILKKKPIYKFWLCFFNL
jgi:hypothetical protein